MTVETESARLPRAEEQEYIASQWKLVWRRFLRHRLAVASSVVIFLFFFIAVFAEFLATADPEATLSKRAFVPPQGIQFFDGLKPTRPYVYGLVGERDPVTRRWRYSADESTKIPIRVFVRGYEYKLLGVFKTNWHLFGLDTDEDPMPFYPLGTDRMGRDMLSRLMLATRISMSIGLVGVGMSLFLGVLLGGLSGYYAGWVDVAIQRLIEFTMSIPTLPLWLALSASVPQTWSVLRVYFALTIIISLIGWTTLARHVRGRFLALREEDFVVAARLYGSSPLRIIFRHMLPSFFSHIIAITTLAVPGMIIAETALSFLGLGLRPPVISWGVLLKEAQNVQSVALAPWLLIPGAFVIIAILALNFMGDGLRDAADPYSVKR